MILSSRGPQPKDLLAALSDNRATVYNPRWGHLAALPALELGKFGRASKEAVPTLAKAVKGAMAFPEVTAYAALCCVVVLGEIGQDAAAALPTFRASLADPKTAQALRGELLEEAIAKIKGTKK